MRLSAPDSKHISLLDLKDSHCRWPIGDPKEPGFGFCGADKAIGSYCAHHAERAFDTSRSVHFAKKDIWPATVRRVA